MEMRKQEKAIIWPAYFDQAKTRKKGRRVPKSLAVQAPKIAEITSAAESLGLEHELAPTAGYPKTPWIKTGMIMIEKKGTKEQVIEKIGKQILILRNEKKE